MQKGGIGFLNVSNINLSILVKLFGNLLHVADGTTFTAFGTISLSSKLDEIYFQWRFTL